MLVVTMPEIPGYRIEAVLGEVVGAGMTTPGPQLERMYRARTEATGIMWQLARQRGANAVVGFSLTPIVDATTVLCCYAVGTAVWVAPIPEGEPGATPQSIEDAKQRAESQQPSDAWQSSPGASQPLGQPSPFVPQAGPMPGPYPQPSPMPGPMPGYPQQPPAPGYAPPAQWGPPPGQPGHNYQR